MGIASAIFKNQAFSGGNEMVLYGIAFHFGIAFIFTIFYFLIFPYIPFLRKQKIISGLLYGFFVWVVMNLIILPLVFPNRAALTIEAVLIGAPILMLMIGLPISYFVNKYYAINNGIKRWFH